MKILFVIYDNESVISSFPLGVAYLASYIRQNGFDDITIYQQDMYHYPDEHLTEYLDTHHFDVLGLGIIGGYYQYKKLLKLSEAVNKSKDRPFFVLGGHGPTPEPEFFLKKSNADAIVMGEGEIPFLNLLKTLSTNGSLKEVKGLAYREGEEVFVNPREELVQNIDDLPFPAWDLFPMDFYTAYRIYCSKATERNFQLISGRGCPFRCNFCYRMDPGFRARSSESVIEEMAVLKRDYNVTFFHFTDELLMTSKARVFDFCEKLIKANLGIRFLCCGRLNFATKEVLTIMKAAGCVFINYGIESMDDQALKSMHKDLTTMQVIKGVEATIEVGIHPGLNIIWGNIGEDKETLQKGVDFLLKYNTHAQLRTIRPVTPYPGSPLYYYSIEKKLLEGPEDFYENKHRNSDLMAVNFTNLSYEDFHKCLYEANKTLIEDYFDNARKTNLNTLKKLYLDLDPDFRGFRAV